MMAESSIAGQSGKRMTLDTDIGARSWKDELLRLTEVVGRYSRRKREKVILERVCRVLQQLMEQTSR